MAGGAALAGQDALGRDHAVHVIRLGELAHHDDRTFLGLLLASVCIEVGPAHSCARGRVHAHAEPLAFLRRDLLGRCIELRVQERVDVVGADAQHGILLGDHAFVDHVHRDLDGRGRGALPIAGLQHPQLAALDGELNVLHVLVVVLEDLADLREFRVGFRQVLGHPRDLLGGADAGDHVLALRVDQVLAVELLFARGRVARERDAGSGGVAHVAEHHRLHVDGGAPVARDAVHAAVVDRAVVVPGAEHGADRLEQLHLRVLRELGAHDLEVERLVLLDDLLEVVRIELVVEVDALLLLDAVQNLLKFALGNLHHDVGEHLDEAAVGVVGEPLVLREVRKPHDGHVVQAQVQNRVHHAGQRRARAGADGHEERVLDVAELLAADSFGLLERLFNLLEDLGHDDLAVVVVAGAGLGGDRKALRNRQAEIGHFGEVRTLAAEQIAHARVALAEEIDILMRHVFPPTLNSDV